MVQSRPGLQSLLRTDLSKDSDKRSIAQVKVAEKSRNIESIPSSLMGTRHALGNLPGAQRYSTLGTAARPLSLPSTTGSRPLSEGVSSFSQKTARPAYADLGTKPSNSLHSQVHGSRQEIPPSSDDRYHGQAPLTSRKKLAEQGEASHQHVPSAGSYTLEHQEKRMIEDLLFGIDGKHIKIILPKGLREEEGVVQDEDEVMDFENNMTDASASWDAVRFHVDNTLDPSAADLVHRILPIATYYMSIDAFVELHSRFEFGFVSHALCAAIKKLTKEFLILIAQLEHKLRSDPSFTLQKLWFYVQPTMNTMRILHSLVTQIREMGDLDDRQSANEGSITMDGSITGGGSHGGEDIAVSPYQKGGSLLSILAERLVGQSGDPMTKKLYAYLLAHASKPYLNILDAWTRQGEIKDPYSEFMVQEKKNLRYTIRDVSVPKFLDSLKDKVLLAGKYLNVIRECGIRIQAPSSEDNTMDVDESMSQSSYIAHGSRRDIMDAVDGGRFITNLDFAYKYANRKLLELLLQDQDLMGVLRSMKHYFFLDQSDFLLPFLDVAKDELRKPSREVSITRLQSLLDLVLRSPSSVAAYDPYKENVKVEISGLRLVDQLLRIINVAGFDGNNLAAGSKGGKWIGSITPGLKETLQGSGNTTIDSIDSDKSNTSNSSLTGYDALTLDYTVTFPLSLILSRKALTKYQLLFRHLLYLKHVESLLSDTWADQKDPIWRRPSQNADLNRWKFRIFALRNRMLTFVQQFATYVTNEVLEVNWRMLENGLSSISTVDQVLQLHSDFLDTCLKECMLTNAKLLRIYSKLMSACALFTTYTERFTRALTYFTAQAKGHALPAMSVTGQDIPQYTLEKEDKMLGKFEENYLYHIRLLIDALNYYSVTETPQFGLLVVRLDVNMYYARDRKQRDSGPKDQDQMQM
ncbi:hypothetical protein BZG36_00995 [Bifiguratus adelaidae]|uniref:Spindle pole body component n=1 Tax=Bifiguratus adelaidae TaxID=1938954 RepID=A0A261Y6P6_9FUNG|nr:hypothetical protein BZG36_00995 [Bifiguratus adelaidae]